MLSTLRVTIKIYLSFGIIAGAIVPSKRIEYFLIQLKTNSLEYYFLIQRKNFSVFCLFPSDKISMNLICPPFPEEYELNISIENFHFGTIS